MPEPKTGTKVSRQTRVTPRIENQWIRDALQEALALESEPFNLLGRGHEPRLTLDKRLAAILRGVELPCAWISGYGANGHYPTRLFRRAEKILKRKHGWSPISVYQDRAYRSDLEIH